MTTQAYLDGFNSVLEKRSHWDNEPGMPTGAERAARLEAYFKAHPSKNLPSRSDWRDSQLAIASGARIGKHIDPKAKFFTRLNGLGKGINEASMAHMGLGTGGG